MNHADANKLFRRQKGALTRAQNGDPTKVLAAVKAFVDDWDTAGMPWPDDWHRWQRAAGDAGFYGDIRDL